MKTENFSDYSKQLSKAIEGGIGSQGTFIDYICNNLIAQALNEIKENTPVAEIDGGTLRRGWTGGKDIDGPVALYKFAKSNVPKNKAGKTVRMTLKNPVEYAVYVENGHRTRGPSKASPIYLGWTPGLGRRWIKGQFMARDSLKHIENHLSQVLDKYMTTYIKNNLT